MFEESLGVDAWRCGGRSHTTVDGCGPAASMKDEDRRLAGTNAVASNNEGTRNAFAETFWKAMIDSRRHKRGREDQ